MFNGSPPATVIVDLMATLVSAGGDQVPVWAVLRYDLSDPYAIHAIFTLPSGPPVPWVFARDLLTNGMLGAAGIGDVLVWRTSPDDQRTMPDDQPDVYIGLMSPDGEALLRFSGAELATFLVKSYARCLPGDELAHLDVDLAIERLLAS
jgi:hypothetical protein